MLPQHNKSDFIMDMLKEVECHEMQKNWMLMKKIKIDNKYCNSNVKLKTAFSFNNKSSLLKFLCTLAGLCKGIPFQPLRLNFFGINFPSHPCSQLTFLTFRGQDNKGESAQNP